MNVGADWQGTAFLLMPVMPARARFDSRFIAKINFECVAVLHRRSGLSDCRLQASVK
jgi:hypothetical protein